MEDTEEQATRRLIGRTHGVTHGDVPQHIRRAQPVETLPRLPTVEARHSHLDAAGVADLRLTEARQVFARGTGDCSEYRFGCPTLPSGSTRPVPFALISDEAPSTITRPKT
ncbi:hypothetical protein [Bifidobacterium catulorum]|uniref:hypothetical protein n=1 Tax=Bifidobacterium catulorum TaxID=1630173 RepID=UPI001F4DE134|nr:hypothetical protein [Bifidobacterium catulorum]